MSDAYIIKRGGSGAGDGNYAIINITYDVGEQVTVAHNGETYEAPDTSGVWLFGCEEAGTYVCSIVNALTPTSETVEITDYGEIEYVSLEDQVVNYLLVARSRQQALWTKGVVSSRLKFAENNARDISQYQYAFLNQKQTGLSNIRTSLHYADTFNISQTLPSQQILINQASNVGYDSFYQTAINSEGLTNKYLLIGFSYGSTSTSSDGFFYLHRPDEVSVDVRTVGFTKEDDISGLSQYGSTISDILTNSVQLFENPTAVRYIARKCTGNFMISALSNSTFKSAMNNSDNKQILLANEHWSMFIGFVS